MRATYEVDTGVTVVTTVADSPEDAAEVVAENIYEGAPFEKAEYTVRNCDNGERWLVPITAEPTVEISAWQAKPVH